jgi:hypothetical protein
MRMMSAWLWTALLAAGCATQKPPAPAPPSPSARKISSPVVTPDLRPVGRVAMVNLEARFVVLTFPAGPVPPPGRQLNVNHAGLKIGELKITGPQNGYDTVADLIHGEVNVGDDAQGE